MKKYHSIQSIKYLYYISSILGIAPFFNFKSNKYCTSIIHAGYSVTWCILEIGFTLYDVIGRISHSYVDLNVPAIFMDVLSLFLQTVTMVYLTIHLTLYRKNKFQMLIEDLNDFDKKCCNMQLDERPNKIFYLKVFIYHLIFVLFCASDAYMWNKRLGFRVLRYYISRYVQVYKFVTFAFLFYNYVLIINDRFVYLNDTLVKYVTLSNNSYLIHDCTQETMVNNAEEDSIKKFNCLYTSMYDTVNLFNEVFGCIILLMCITIVVGLLQPINIAFSYAKTDLNSQRKSMDSDLIVVCILWALLYLICAIMIVIPCDEATQEAQKTSYLSHKLINDLPVCNKQQNMKEDLILLAQHTYQHSPKFSAYGFYYIDHMLLSSMLASVTSYLIVLIQLN